MGQRVHEQGLTDGDPFPEDEIVAGILVAARRKRLCRTFHPYPIIPVAVGARASQCREAALRAAGIL